MKKSVILVFIILGFTEATVDENDLNVQEASDDPAIDDSSPNWLPFDNMNSALKGYDIMAGNPLSDGRDPGYRQQIFKPTVKNADNRYVLHPAYTFDNGISCKLDMKVDISSTIEQYRKSRTESSKSGYDLQIGSDVEVTVSGKIKKVDITAKTTIPPVFTRAWGKSRDFQKMQGFFTNKKSLVATSSAKCQLYQITIHTWSSRPPLMEPFKQSIKKLDRASSADTATKLRAFRSFIQNYGTHFSVQTTLGGEIIHRTVFSSSTKKKFDEEKIKKCEHVKGSRIFGIQVEQDKSGCSTSDEKSLYNSYGSTLESSTMSKGAPPDKSVHNWAKQKFKPVPLTYKLAPIINLFKEKYLDKELHVSASNILKWFVPLYFNFCVSMYGKECEKKTGCGYDDQCPTDTDCVPGSGTHTCTEWSNWSCQDCKGIRTRKCDGCSGKTIERKTMEECKKANACLDDCLLPGKDYSGHDLNACSGRADTAKNCQASCQRTSGCFKFTYITATQTCCLKPALDIPLTDRVGVTSGPKFCSGVPAVSRKGSYKYFVRADRVKAGGRFYECKVTSLGYYANVVIYGYTIKFHKSQVFKMGCPLNVGDDVIAYWHRHDRFAYAGYVTNRKPGYWYVTWANGDKDWVKNDSVYKMIRMDVKGCGEARTFA